jgi:peptidoglycan/LPS O-acetylase OafA/YrhL
MKREKSIIIYRPEIDGLRALAVAAVVGFHAFPTIVPGGYVGVDVFFVISGFLITSIIVDGLARDRFSLAGFYIRRIRRIFPALTIMLAACLAAGWLLLLPNEFVALGKHVASGAAFISNFVDVREAGYFDQRAELKPLLHLWSLGIEEQFYLVWPIIAILAFRFKNGVFTAALAIVLGRGLINAQP